MMSRRSGIDRESVHLVTMNFPGFGGEWRDLRLPVCCIDKAYIAKRDTLDDILAVVLCSLQYCCANRWPTTRHDEASWHAADSKRKSKVWHPLGVRALLAQLTGDRKMWKDILRFPQHHEVSECCWKYNANTNLAARHHEHSAMAC